MKRKKHPRMLVQRHKGTSWHYDLRLEEDGVFRSWAVPKGFPEDGSRRLAVVVKDHDLLKCWKLPLDLETDTQVMVTKTRFETLRRADTLWHFRVLKGVLKGEWCLRKFKGEKNWLLSRENNGKGETG